jgi:16S rRNA (uracil1498-N3)-methyltransferase
VTDPLFFADVDRLRAATIGEVFELDGPEGHHAATVRRLAVGEKLELSDGAGLVFSAVVTAVRGHALQVELSTRLLVGAYEPRITVVQALAKGDRDELAVQTMTEVGVDAIVPWQASRSIVRWDDAARAEKALARWRSTAREAAKQARRPWLVDVPALATTRDVAARIESAVANKGVAVVLHEASDRPLTELAFADATEVVLVIGPEGGIADDEIAAFETAGAATCRLGPTVLRTSTAGTVAATIVLANSGRWS